MPWYTNKLRRSLSQTLSRRILIGWEVAWKWFCKFRNCDRGRFRPMNYFAWCCRISSFVPKIYDKFGLRSQLDSCLMRASFATHISIFRYQRASCRVQIQEWPKFWESLSLFRKFLQGGARSGSNNQILSPSRVGQPISTYLWAYMCFIHKCTCHVKTSHPELLSAPSSIAYQCPVSLPVLEFFETLVSSGKLRLRQSL